MKKTEENQNMPNGLVEDKGSFGWAVLGFFFPLIGLILYLVWSTSRKGDAKKAGIGALVGFLSKVILVPIITIFVGAAFYLSIWPSVQDKIVEQTCQTYGKEYHAYRIEEDDEELWGCKNARTGEILKIDEDTGIIEGTEESKNISEDSKLFYEDYEYGVLLEEKIDNFSNLDFDSKAKDYSDSKIEIVNGKILFQLSDYKQIEVPNINNAVSARLSCDCGECVNLYYLNSNNQIYYIELDFEDIEEGSNNVEYSKRLVANDAIGIDTVEYLGATTCGGVELVYKNKDNQIKLVYDYDDDIKYVDVNLRQIKWLNSNVEAPIYGVNDTKIISNMLKDQNGKTLVCANLFTEWDDNDINTYIISDNGYLYYFGEKELKNRIGKLLFDSKVQDFKEENGKIIITFVDGKTLVLDAVLDY